MAEVLVIGSGGRESALAQAMELSPEVTRVEVSPDINAIEDFSRADKPFVVIGPEQPLADGKTEVLRNFGYTVFGASKDAAQYEASKARTIRMAENAGVTQPDTFIAEGDDMPDLARAYATYYEPLSYVIKADGLASGKGVVLPSSKEEALMTVERMIAGEYNGSGREIINFAKRKSGPEVSAMVVVGSGSEDFIVLPLSQDHKRLRDRDRGPNTGGMGAYAPVPDSIIDLSHQAKIEENAHRLLATMEAEGVKFQGAVMYMGLMLSDDLEKGETDLLEINVRFGDPETQVVLPLLTSAGVDVYRLLRSAAEFELERPQIDVKAIGKAALTVCLASRGYPGEYQVGDEIHGLDRDYDNVVVQLAGVDRRDEGYFTSGGRVLYVTGLGENIDAAASHAYSAIGKSGIHFSGYQYRKDIGWQARS